MNPATNSSVFNVTLSSSALLSSTAVRNVAEPGATEPNAVSASTVSFKVKAPPVPQEPPVLAAAFHQSPSSYMTNVLSECSNPAWDVRLQGLYTLVALAKSGEFQRLVVSSSAASSASSSTMPFMDLHSPDGGAVDVLLGVLRQCIVHQKTLLNASLQTASHTLSALANLIEYTVNPMADPHATQCPRLSVSRAAVLRLLHVGGLRSIHEAVLLALGELGPVLEDGRENSIIFRDQVIYEGLRTLVSFHRHTGILLVPLVDGAPPTDDMGPPTDDMGPPIYGTLRTAIKAKEEFDATKRLTTHLLIVGHRSTKSNVKAMVHLLSQSVCAILKITVPPPSPTQHDDLMT